MIEIPLTANPEQIFNITLNGENYDIRIILNSRAVIWSISFSQNGVPIVEGIALVGGVDILDQYNLDIANMWVVNLEKPNHLDPTVDNLGTIAKLFMLTDEEVNGG